MLRALLLLLRLSDDGGLWDKHFLSTAGTTSSSTMAAAAVSDDKLDDNVTYDNEGKISRAPLVSILRRVGEIPVREIKQYGGRKKDENLVSCEALKVSSLYMFYCVMSVYLLVCVCYKLTFCLCRMWVWLVLQQAPPSATWIMSHYPMTTLLYWI